MHRGGIKATWTEEKCTLPCEKIAFALLSMLISSQSNVTIRFEEGPRIPGSMHFNIDDVALTPDLNPDSLPHMLPTPVSLS